jgi:cell pole-organizing protein PopZ
VVVEVDVLELTEVVQEPAPTAAAPADEIVFQTIEEPAPAVSGSDIFSDKTRAAIDNAFNKLDSEEEAADEPAPSPMASTFRSTTVDGNSVEAVFERAVRDAVGPHIDQWMSAQKNELLAGMKPLIREWMDEHFPAILEGAVRDEVARAVKARGKR